MTVQQSAHPAARAEFLDGLRYYQAIDSQLAENFELKINKRSRG